MKKCQWCGADCIKRKTEAAWQYAERKFCSRSCADKGRARTTVPNDQFKAPYRQIKINGKRYLEHRYVMERVLGRPLRGDEQVHHKNHDRLDNRPENLEVVSTAEHGLRHTKHPISKNCVICGQEFTPHKTKRVRAQTCGSECKSQLLSLRHQQRRDAA